MGALALVLVAGAVLVGVKSTGARSGATTSTNATVTCTSADPPPIYFDSVTLTVTPTATLNGVVLTLALQGGTNSSVTFQSLGAANSVAITSSATYQQNFSYWVSWTAGGTAYETKHFTACG